MNNPISPLLKQLIPFAVLGTVIALFIGFIMLFYYLLIWGLIIGGLLWLSNIIRTVLFSKSTTSKSQGIIIEHRKEK